MRGSFRHFYELVLRRAKPLRLREEAVLDDRGRPRLSLASTFRITCLQPSVISRVI